LGPVEVSGLGRDLTLRALNLSLLGQPLKKGDTLEVVVDQGEREKEPTAFVILALEQ